MTCGSNGLDVHSPYDIKLNLSKADLLKGQPVCLCASLTQD
jgi:hypothetical protein